MDGGKGTSAHVSCVLKLLFIDIHFFVIVSGMPKLCIVSVDGSGYLYPPPVCPAVKTHLLYNTHTSTISKHKRTRQLWIILCFGVFPEYTVTATWVLIQRFRQPYLADSRPWSLTLVTRTEDGPCLQLFSRWTEIQLNTLQDRIRPFGHKINAGFSHRVR